MDADEKNLDYFIARFTELADDAEHHGLSVVVLIENADPISKQSGIWTATRGTRATAIGLIWSALMNLR